MSKKSKFNRVWVTQTELGKVFGISARKVGIELESSGYKDKEGGTEKARKEDMVYRVESKDGRVFWMWNKQKCIELLSKKYNKLDFVDMWVNEIKLRLGQIEKLEESGEFKVADLSRECLFDDIPRQLKQKVIDRLDIK